MNEKRFVAIDDDELYYITDTEGLKTVDDFIKEFSKPEYEFTKDEAMEHAKEEYWQMIYEASMTATENVELLNKLYDENNELKQLLEEIRHEITCIDGLTATDSTNIQENIKDNYHMFQLEYSELLKKIDKVIK